MIRSLPAVLLLLAALAPTASSAAEVTLNWSRTPDRIWAGPNWWCNRLHDWRVVDQTLECVAPARLGHRTAHVLTHRLGREPGSFEATVVLELRGRGKGCAGGLLLGAGGGAIDHRSAALIHQWPGPGAGFLVGLTRDGRLFVHDFTTNPPTQLVEHQTKTTSIGPATITVTATPRDDGNTLVELRLEGTGTRPAEQTSAVVPSGRLAGNVALFSHAGTGPMAAQARFRELRLQGDRLEHHPDDEVGPILSTQYTLSRNVLKLTAQLLPIADSDDPTVFLEVQRNGTWKSIARTKLIRPGWTAPFRVENWDDDVDTPYRVSIEWDHFATDDDASIREGSFTGTIRRDPVDKETIVVAGFTGNHMVSHGIGRPRTPWSDGVWFPHAEVVEHVAAHDPDLLFFSGDQVYEGRSPTFADTHPDRIQLDYLYKWYLWCWAYRDITRDRPTITMPDDHDVYQGNIWGQGGRKSPRRDHDGGYVHPAEFVKLVERTQTSHLPDPFDPTPVEQGIGVYYTGMVYGRIGLAILEDRKFKSGCARDDMPPSGTGRPDHFNDPEFDVSKLDVEGAHLLGDRQLKFLRHWAGDWAGHDMKLAVSQTIFANMATHHGGDLQRLIADLDSNGWPQTGRNRALAELRRGFALHLAGDQHLATIVHHGIEEHGDAIWSFCVPSVANFYPRAWAPTKQKYEFPEPNEYLGRWRDGFGHPVIVHAATNPGRDQGRAPAGLHNGMPGYGIVRMNKSKRTITMECWPRDSDPRDPAAKQYFGWPRTIEQLDNHRREPAAHLPRLEVVGMTNPVVRVFEESTNELVYALRLNGTEFTPFVFDRDAQYRVEVGEPGTPRLKTFEHLAPGDGTIAVDLTE